MKLRRGQTEDVLLWVLVGLGVAAVVGLVIFLLLPKEQYIEIDGVRVWKIPNDAQIVSINQSQAPNVKALVQRRQLLAFEGYAVGTGTPQDQEVAKIRAFQNVAEFLNARVQTFAQLVEGQLQNVQVSGQKQQLVSASVSAYKRVTELLADARISGAYVFAVWRTRTGNVVNTYVLLVYDPASILKVIEMDAQVKQVVDELGRQGVNFFENLNAVMAEALKGTPLERK